MNFKSRFTTAIATGAVLLNALAPVAFADTITVTGNGAGSLNAANLSSNQTTVVNQNNNLNVNNNVDAKASTGGNDAGFNTGGNVTVNTGNANTSVDLSTSGNLNKATVDCCDNGSTTVNISGNGALSTNAVDVDKDNRIVLSQNNNANINNDVDAKAYTGNNDAGFNTGGDVTINTGNASANVSVENTANANLASVGGHGGPSNGSSVSILGNGALSLNAVDLNLGSAIVLDQNNNANIDNDVDAKAKTGNNDASFNTGGDVAINTGNAKTNVDVANLVNFNAADVDCDCALGDLEVKIAGNGAESLNSVSAELCDALIASAYNNANLDNDVDGKAKTGNNDAGFNTGEPNGDPSVNTGDATSDTEVSNSGNVNLFNQDATLHLPGDWDLDFNWDLHGLFGFLAFFASA